MTNYITVRVNRRNFTVRAQPRKRSDIPGTTTNSDYFYVDASSNNYVDASGNNYVTDGDLVLNFFWPILLSVKRRVFTVTAPKRIRQ